MTQDSLLITIAIFAVLWIGYFIDKSKDKSSNEITDEEAREIIKLLDEINRGD